MARSKKLTIDNITNQMFWDTGIRNKISFINYFDRLCELAISVFKWEGLPPTVDWRFMEMTLLYDGFALFFKDPIMGYLSLQCMIGGRLDVYRIPIDRRAYASNGYQSNQTSADSVLIFDNLLHQNKVIDLARYASDLYELDQIIMINARAQKTPILIIADESQRLTLKNLYQKYEGNQPVIYGSTGLQSNPLQAINTGAPFVANELYQLRTQIWNEALTYIGIPNVQSQKKERLITDEVARMNAGSIASRFSRLEARRQACEQINNMFPDLSVDVDYRDTDEDNNFDIPDVPSAERNAIDNAEEGDENE